MDERIIDRSNWNTHERASSTWWSCLVAGMIDGLVSVGGGLVAVAPGYSGFWYPAEVVSYCI